MTSKALATLDSDPDGFILMVEGARVDHAEHGNSITNALADLMAFDDAVAEAMAYQWDRDDVLVIVTADHDCGGPAISGYPPHSELAKVVEGRSPYMRWISDAHTVIMVPVIARGPASDSFSGIQDNTDLHHRMKEALGL
jgi:alkaline phosphatase